VAYIIDSLKNLLSDHSARASQTDRQMDRQTEMRSH